MAYAGRKEDVAAQDRRIVGGEARIAQANVEDMDSL